jgi:soluble lytic murein transglycosylase-like protein
LKKCSIFLSITALLLLLTASAGADLGVQTSPQIGKIALKSQTPSQIRKFDPWPQTPPKIGRLELKQEYWGYMKEAARKYQVSPYLIQAVCAIESRYDPYASSGHGRCYGLMQLHKDTARKYGVDSRNPRENIMGGAAVLARLLTKYDGDLRRVLRVYNAECTAAYEREVIKAFNQAMSSSIASRTFARNRN